MKPDVPDSLVSAARWTAARSRRLLAAHAALSTIAALGEATLLVLVAHLGVQLTRGETPTVSQLGAVGLGTSGAVVAAVVIGFALVVLTSNLAVVGLVARLQTATLASIRAEAHAAYGGSSWSIQADDSLGEVQKLLAGHALRASTAAMWLSVLLRSSVMVAVLMLSALLLDPVTAIVGVVAGAAFAALLAPLIRRTKRLARSAAVLEGDYALALTDVTSAALELKAFGLSSEFMRQLDVKAELAQVAQEHSRRRALQIPEIYKGVLLVCIAAAVAFATPSPAAAVSLGAIALLFLRALGQVSTVQSAVAGLVESTPYIGLVEDALARYREAADRPVGTGSFAVDRIDQLEFLDVGFTYGGERPVLEGLNLTVRRGTSIGIVGASGTGKSTLLQVLLGLRSPTTGSLIVNGMPAGDVDMEHLRGRIGFMPQQSWLIAGSVASNIRFSRPISDREVERAAQLAGVERAIPGGVEADVGQRGGAGLSGGQRQRVGLARALAACPDLLVLDEPTSSLDEDSELELREALRLATNEIGVVLVTHRRALLDICDEVYSLDQGHLTRIEATHE